MKELETIPADVFKNRMGLLVFKGAYSVSDIKDENT